MAFLKRFKIKMGRCIAQTLKGTQCKRIINGEYCSDHKEKETCGICMDPLKCQSITQCGHKFCKHCINNWVCVSCPNYSCPMCRGELQYSIINDGLNWGLNNNLILCANIHTLSIDSLGDHEGELLIMYLNIFKHTYLSENDFINIKNLANDNEIINELFQKLLKNIKITKVIAKIDSENKFTKNIYTFI